MCKWLAVGIIVIFKVLQDFQLFKLLQNGQCLERYWCGVKIVNEKKRKTEGKNSKKKKKNV